MRPCVDGIREMLERVRRAATPGAWAALGAAAWKAYR